MIILSIYFVIQYYTNYSCIKTKEREDELLENLELKDIGDTEVYNLRQKHESSTEITAGFELNVPSITIKQNIFLIVYPL